MNVFRSWRTGEIITIGTTSCTNVLRNNGMKFRPPNIHRLLMGQTYEGTGKTTGHIVNKRGAPRICVDQISTKGFLLTNGWRVVGPTIFFPHTVISWSIENMNDISKESLTLFSVLNPKVDLLLLGVGRKEDISYERTKELITICKEMKINFEIMSTENAAATFNFCSLENRFVSAALIPPSKLTFHHEMNLIQGSNLPAKKDQA